METPVSPTEPKERKHNCVAHCTACNRHFTGLAPFEAHRVVGECTDPAELVFGDKSVRAGLPILQAISGRCAFMPGCWKDGRLLKRVDHVDLWQMAAHETPSDAQAVLF